MLVLRCTARFLDRIKTKPDSAPPASTTGLGDLYANLIHIGRTQLVLGMCERTFLPVVIPAAPANTLIPRLRDGVVDALRGLGVNEDTLWKEAGEMHDVIIAKTANRQAVGMMVEFAKALEWGWDSYGSLENAAQKLASMVCMPLRPDPFPDKATKRLFGASET